MRKIEISTLGASRPSSGAELNGNLNPATLSEAVRKQFYRRQQANFIEQRWMKQVRNSAYFFGELFYQFSVLI